MPRLILFPVLPRNIDADCRIGQTGHFHPDNQPRRHPAPETANDLSDLPHVDPDGHDMLWIRVTGFGDISPIKTVGETYGIPSLALEDAMSPGWRAEMTDEGDWLFFVLPVPPADFITEKSEHLSLFFRRNLVITFEESPTLLIDRFWQQSSVTNPTKKSRIRPAITPIVSSIRSLTASSRF